jgi:cobalamin biosynthesis protein CobD/CbiB
MFGLPFLFVVLLAVLFIGPLIHPVILRNKGVEFSKEAKQQQTLMVWGYLLVIGLLLAQAVQRPW